MSKYIIDTSAMLSQKSDEQYRRNVYRTLWNKIDELVEKKEIITCSEIAAEVQDEDIKKWIKTSGMQILPIDDDVQDNVRQIVTIVNPTLIDFKENKSSGDAFLIATAKKYDLIVLTEENPYDMSENGYQICEHSEVYGRKQYSAIINIMGLCRLLEVHNRRRLLYLRSGWKSDGHILKLLRARK